MYGVWALNKAFSISLKLKKDTKYICNNM